MNIFSFIKFKQIRMTALVVGSTLISCNNQIDIVYNQQIKFRIYIHFLVPETTSPKFDSNEHTSYTHTCAHTLLLVSTSLCHFQAWSKAHHHSVLRFKLIQLPHSVFTYLFHAGCQIHHCNPVAGIRQAYLTISCKII